MNLNSIKNLKYILSGLVLVLFTGADFVFAQDHVGNGGDAVVCKNPDGSQKVYLFDFFLDFSQLERNKFTQSDFEIIKQNILKIRPDMSPYFESWMAEIRNPYNFTSDDLPEIPDEGGDYQFTNPNCKLKQLAVNYFRDNSVNKQLKINKPLFDQLTPVEQYGLFMHEFLYKWRIQSGSSSYELIKNSIMVRTLNVWLFSRQFNENPFSTDKNIKYIIEHLPSFPKAIYKELDPIKIQADRFIVESNGYQIICNHARGVAYPWSPMKTILSCTSADLIYLETNKIMSQAVGNIKLEITTEFYDLNEGMIRNNHLITNKKLNSEHFDVASREIIYVMDLGFSAFFKISSQSDAYPGFTLSLDNQKFKFSDVKNTIVWGLPVKFRELDLKTWENKLVGLGLIYAEKDSNNSELSKLMATFEGNTFKKVSTK